MSVVAGLVLVAALGTVASLARRISWLDQRELVLTSEGELGAAGTVVVLGCGSD